MNKESMGRGRWFFTADPHLNHPNIIKYCNRPFMSAEERGLLEMVEQGLAPLSELKISKESAKKMTDTIINSYNKVVGVDDKLVIIGDFCWLPRDNAYIVAKVLRDRIICKNVYLIWGNHDDRAILNPFDFATGHPNNALFTKCYDQYVFNVNGQHIFTNHYPARSWDMAHHGCWGLYGHVHAALSPEDNGELLPWQRNTYTEGFDDILTKYGIDDSNRGNVIDELLKVVQSTMGIDYTCDVGVDNLIRGEDIPFGTPWSMDDLYYYMGQKKDRWNARQAAFKKLAKRSTLKR